MGVNVTLVVPSASPQDVAPIIGAIVHRWDGVTVWRADGYWKDSAGAVICDRVSVLACSVGDFDDAAYEWWHDRAEAVRRAFTQDSVFLSFTPQNAELVGDGHTTRIGGNDKKFD